MSFHHQGKIAKNGLVIYYDAKNPDSAQDTAWNDLMKSYDSVVTDPSYNSNGWYEFNTGSNTWAQHDDLDYDSSSNWSFSLWMKKPSGTSTAWQAFCGSNVANIGGYWMFHPYLGWYQDYYDDGGGYQYYGCMAGNEFDNFDMGTHIDFDKWFNLTIMYDSSAVTATAVLNDNEVTETQSVIWSPRVTDFRFKYIAAGYPTNRWFYGNIATYMVWNRILTADEIFQNFYALKSRYL